MTFLSLHTTPQLYQRINWSVVKSKTVERQKPVFSAKTLVYLEADANYSWIYYANGSRTLTARTLKYHQAKLSPTQFVRLNRMVLVNRQFIERVERYLMGYKIYLSTGVGFFVSRRRWQAVRQQLTHQKILTQAEQATILLIEDNEDQHVIMQYMLQQQFPSACSVGKTTSGQALNYLTRCQEANQVLPELILLDLYLPKREDGWELLRQLRARPELQHTPIVVISASSDPKDIEESHYWGANAYITKPVFGHEWKGHFMALHKYWRQENECAAN